MFIWVHIHCLCVQYQSAACMVPYILIIIIISSSCSGSSSSSIIVILVITFMQFIYSYVPETNHISRVYSVAAVPYLQFVLHVMLFCPWNVLIFLLLLLLCIIKICISKALFAKKNIDFMQLLQ